jgi:hypothetical protein
MMRREGSERTGLILYYAIERQALLTLRFRGARTGAWTAAGDADGGAAVVPIGGRRHLFTIDGNGRFGSGPRMRE